MSIWNDKDGRKHVGVMVQGKRVHRIMPAGATVRDAKLVEAEIRASISRMPKHVVIPDDPRMTAILELYVEHAQHLRSSVTSKSHAMRLEPLARKFKASEAQEFGDLVIKEMRTKYAPATISRSLACAKKGLEIAWRQRLIPENYGLRIKSLAFNNNREVFLSVDEVRSIAQHCAIQAQAAIWFALLTGARRGEIFLIRAEHIGADTIMLPASHTKTNRARVIPIIPALRPWLEHFPLTLTVEGMKSAWRHARVIAGMPHVNFHDLRHSCVSILVAFGVDLYTISKVLGHSSLQSTQRYAHLQVEPQRAALQKIGQLVDRSTT